MGSTFMYMAYGTLAQTHSAAGRRISNIKWEVARQQQFKDIASVCVCVFDGGVMLIAGGCGKIWLSEN